MSSGWELVFDSPVYESLEAFSDPIFDASSGALLFCAYLDAFSHSGMTYKWPNIGDDLARFGALPPLYPVDESPPGFAGGWIGVP